jgi:hypothetical protein
MNFNRVNHSHTQINNASPETVFPLICPVREEEWLDDWSYEMIFSESGIAEQDCVFQTEANGEKITWIVSNYDPINYTIEFIRTDNISLICHISISLKPFEETKTKATIKYSYTALSEEGNLFIDDYSTEDYLKMMDYWKESINTFLAK